MKINKTLLTLSISAAMALNSYAENETLNDVTVTSYAFDAQVNSISKEQLEEVQASDIKDILKSLPSVVVDGNARYGQKIYVRGMEDKFANITVDGAKMMGGQIWHHAGDQTVDASLLKVSSIELGPNSALTGPGVVNGSFSYETKDPSDYLKENESFGGKVSLGYETARERKKGSVAVFSKINDKLEFVGIGSFTNDGTLHLGNGSKIENKESKLKSGLIKFVVKPNDENTIKLSYNVYEDGGNRAYSGEKSGLDQTDDDYNSMHRETLSLKYNYTPANNDYINLEATAYTNKQWQEYPAHQSIFGRTTPETHNLPDAEYINNTIGYDLRNSSILGAHTITVGTDYSKEDQEVKASGLAHNVTTNTYYSILGAGGEVERIGLYFQDEMEFDKLTIIPGLRYDKHKLGGKLTGSFNQFTPKLKVKYALTEKLTLRSGYGKIFKGPELGETASLERASSQSTETKAQTGHNIEVGLDYSLKDALNANDSTLSFNAYKYNLDNYIWAGEGDLSSSGDIEIWGLETMFFYAKNDFSLNASHTYTGGEFTDNNGTKSDPSTTKIHVFKIGANYQLTNELKANYISQFVPGNKYTRSGRSGVSEVKRSGYATHDLHFTYKPKAIKNTSFNFGVENIFDKAYVRHTAHNADTSNDLKAYELGRNFKFQVNYRF